MDKWIMKSSADEINNVVVKTMLNVLSYAWEFFDNVFTPKRIY